MATENLPKLPAFSHPETAGEGDSPIRSFVGPNQELAAAFQRYLQARGYKPSTLVSYGKSVCELLEFLKASSIASVDRNVIRSLFDALQLRGSAARTLRRHTCALRAFFRFIRLTGLTSRDPMVMLTNRKLPTRLPRVLTLKEIERLIAAASSPTETAVAEFFYSAGVRVGELVAMRLEDVDLSAGVARVKKGKGGKDRIILFGRKADKALRRMLDRQPPEAGFLFEARSKPARPFTDRAVRLMIARMGARAGLGKVFPHMLRRCFATHMLEGGADLRVVQELLGHERLSTTCIYTTLGAANLKTIHTKFHPTAEGDHAKS